MSATFKTEAVVLRSIRYGEADRVLHLYSRERFVRRARASRRLLGERRRGRVPGLRGGLVPAGARGARVPGRRARAPAVGGAGSPGPRAGPGGPGDRGDAGAPRARPAAAGGVERRT